MAKRQTAASKGAQPEKSTGLGPGKQSKVLSKKKKLTKPGAKPKGDAVLPPAAAAPPAVGSNWAALRKQIGATGKKKPAKEAQQSVEEEAVQLKPDALGKSTELTHVVAVDCEMVGVGPEGKYSTLARVCIVNNLGNVLMDSYVAQNQKVTDYRTFVSGIRPSDLKNAPLFAEVQKKVSDIVKGRILVGHSIKNDLRALQLTHPRKLIRDTARYTPLMRAPRPGRKPKPRALKKLAAEQLGFEIQSGEHTPVDDARCTLYLYHKHRKEWEKSLRVEKAENVRKSKANNPNRKAAPAQ